MDYQQQIRYGSHNAYGSPNSDEMAEDMFEIHVSPQRTQKINQIQSSMTSNRGTIKKSDQKSFPVEQVPAPHSVSRFHPGGGSARISKEPQVLQDTTNSNK